MARSGRTVALAVLSALGLSPAIAQESAQTFPTRAIHIVIPFPAGGPADIPARLIGLGFRPEHVRRNDER